jgi:hypothetical protein
MRPKKGAGRVEIPASDRLTHVTLTTGDISPARPSRLPASILRNAADLVKVGRGLVMDRPDWYAEVLYPRNFENVLYPGAACFQISEEPDMSVPAVIVGFVCWLEESSIVTWEATRIGYMLRREIYLECGLWRDPQPTPPPVPWVATWLTPQFLPLGLVGADLVQAELAIAGALIDLQPDPVPAHV